jgi:aryl-alcohol dehydrogenase-like predicted oxidoreductase
MQLKPLGQSGLLVSEFCLGSMTFGGKTPAWDARQMLDHFVMKQGGNFLDSANGYNNGAAEEIIGQWMADGNHRPHMIVASKTYLPEDGDANHRGLSRHAIIFSVEQSLRRLQTDFIDIYSPHYWDARVPLEETLRALEHLVQSGKVRYLACSNYLGWQVMQAVSMQKSHGWSPLIALHAQYSLVERGIERELLPLIVQENLGLLAWSPLAGGFLSGKYTPKNAFVEKTRLGGDDLLAGFYREIAVNPRGWAILDTVREIARNRGAEAAQVALAWLRGRPQVSSVIVGGSQIEHIDQNLEATKLNLSASDLNLLDAVSAIDIGYPGYMEDFVDALP